MAQHCNLHDLHLVEFLGIVNIATKPSIDPNTTSCGSWVHNLLEVLYSLVILYPSLRQTNRALNSGRGEGKAGGASSDATKKASGAAGSVKEKRAGALGAR